MNGVLYPRVKRGVDIFAAAGGLTLAAPVMAATAVAVAKNLGPPVLFTQERPGKDGRIFRLYKFRTMLNPDPAHGLVSNEDRMTRFGSLLRSTSLDELPSLWNVLRGDMSLVGPRPLRMKYENRYSDAQRRRSSVRPGLTGLAQVSGRNALSWDDRLDLDLEYIDSQSLIGDLRILFRTVAKVLRREGVQAEGQATMSEFFGPTRIDGMTLRPLAEGDLDTRVEWLSDPAVRDGITIDFWPGREEMRRWFAVAQADRARADFVCVDLREDTPLAMAGWLTEDDTVGSLYIYVGPSAQGRGIGRRTMQILEARARETGLKELRLETKVGNEAAQKMYRRLGYTDSPARPGAGKLTMRKVLL